MLLMIIIFGVLIYAHCEVTFGSTKVLCVVLYTWFACRALTSPLSGSSFSIYTLFFFIFLEKVYDDNYTYTHTHRHAHAPYIHRYTHSRERKRGRIYSLFHLYCFVGRKIQVERDTTTTGIDLFRLYPQTLVYVKLYKV